MSTDRFADELLHTSEPLRLRRPTWADVDGVAALHAAAEVARTGRVRTRPEDVRVRWLGLDGLDDVLLVEHPAASQPIGIGEYTVEADLVDDRPVLHVEGQVHPDWTGHGVATLVLDRAEVRAAAVAAAADTDRVRVRTTVDDGDDRARGWFTSRGFTPVRALVEMRLEFDRPLPEPRWPDGVTVRTLRPGADEPAAWRTYEASFADVATHLPVTLEDWVDDRSRRDVAFTPDLTFLAIGPDGDPVGLALCRAGADGAPEDGFIRDLGVVPDRRGRGIGTALLLTALQAFRERGLTGAALEVDDVTVTAAVHLYQRAGMRIVRRTDVLERPHRPVTA